MKNPLPVQGTWVHSLVQEDSICLRTTKPMFHNRRSHCNEKPMHHERVGPAHCNQRKPRHSNEGPVQLKTKKKKKASIKNIPMTVTTEYTAEYKSAEDSSDIQ